MATTPTKAASTHALAYDLHQATDELRQATDELTTRNDAAEKHIAQQKQVLSAVSDLAEDTADRIDRLTQVIAQNTIMTQQLMTMLPSTPVRPKNTAWHAKRDELLAESSRLLKEMEEEEEEATWKSLQRELAAVHAQLGALI